MRRFIEWLEGLNQKDTKVRAVLRRSLAFDPGAFPPAYPYVEPFVRNERDEWKREMHYLVAGLWAANWREEHTAVRWLLKGLCGLPSGKWFDQHRAPVYHVARFEQW